MGKFRLIPALVLLIGAGALLWFISKQPESPASSWAQSLPSLPGLPNLRGSAESVDEKLAQSIRDLADGKVKAEDIFPLNSVSSATLSAQVSTSPEELWQTFRDQGAQAVIGSLGGNIEYSVNDISTSALNEARYQYCLGVVEAHEASLDSQ